MVSSLQRCLPQRCVDGELLQQVAQLESVRVDGAVREMARKFQIVTFVLNEMEWEQNMRPWCSSRHGHSQSLREAMPAKIVAISASSWVD